MLARRQLGIGEDHLVVLYAPTWREDADDEKGSFRQPAATVDLAALDAGLPDNVVLLSRMHANARSGGRGRHDAAESGMSSAKRSPS